MQKLLVAIALVTLLPLADASAYTECSVTPSSAFAGDGGTFYITYTNGGSSQIGLENLNLQKQVITIALSAILAEKDIDVRYAADGVDCTATLQSISGIRLRR